MKKLLIGTTNKGKILKYGDMLKSIGIDYITPYDLELKVEIKEDGTTTRENARIKAKTYFDATNMNVIALDDALIIDGLKDEEQPKLMVHRYGGKELNDEEMINVFSRLIDKLGGKANGRFESSMCLIKDNDKIYEKTFISPRPFISVPCKTIMPNFALRSLMYYEEYQKYMAEMTLEEMGKAEGSSYDEEKEFIKKIMDII